MISTKAMSVLGILGRLMQNYQPGGLHEKAAVLAALESPNEASNIGEAIAGLRRWIRWKRRAADINVALPDPTVLLRGLDKLVGKVLASNPTSQFRVNLTRNQLMVDTIPNMGAIEQYAETLLAEFDSMAYSRKKDKPVAQGGPSPPPVPKLKKAEEGKGETPAGREEDRGKKKCRFYLSDEGCKKGRSCRWSHDQQDGQKRCWTCGSTEHYSNQCLIKEGSKAGNPRVAKVDQETKPSLEDREKEEVIGEPCVLQRT